MCRIVQILIWVGYRYLVWYVATVWPWELSYWWLYHGYHKRWTITGETKSIKAFIVNPRGGSRTLSDTYAPWYLFHRAWGGNAEFSFIPVRFSLGHSLFQPTRWCLFACFMVRKTVARKLWFLQRQIIKLWVWNSQQNTIRNIHHERVDKYN